jgi:hypothetical protein
MAARNKFLAQDHNNPDTLLFISSRAVDRLSRYEATLCRQAVPDYDAVSRPPQTVGQTKVALSLMPL